MLEIHTHIAASLDMILVLQKIISFMADSIYNELTTILEIKVYDNKVDDNNLHETLTNYLAQLGTVSLQRRQ